MLQAKLAAVQGLLRAARTMMHVCQCSAHAANREHLAREHLCAAALMTLTLACRQQKGSAAVLRDVLSPTATRSCCTFVKGGCPAGSREDLLKQVTHAATHDLVTCPQLAALAPALTLQLAHPYPTPSESRLHGDGAAFGLAFALQVRCTANS